MRSILTVTFINVGYGEAILVTLARQNARPWVMLIDGGSAEAGEFTGDSGRQPAAGFLAGRGIRAIDLLVATHLHEDHICGLEQVVADCEIRRFWHVYRLPPKALDRFGTGLTPSQRKFRAALSAYARLWRALEARGCPMEALWGVREALPLLPGLAADVLGPEEGVFRETGARLDRIYAGSAAEAELDALDAQLNQSSLILRLCYGGRRLLLPADNFLGMDALRHRPQLLRAEVFKTAHHGQPDSMDPQLAGIIAPEYVVTCGSSDRRYGSSHPHTYQTIRQGAPGARFLFSDAVPLADWTDHLAPRGGVEVSVAPDGALSIAYV